MPLVSRKVKTNPFIPVLQTAAGFLHPDAGTPVTCQHARVEILKNGDVTVFATDGFRLFAVRRYAAEPDALPGIAFFDRDTLRDLAPALSTPEIMQRGVKVDGYREKTIAGQLRELKQPYPYQFELKRKQFSEALDSLVGILARKTEAKASSIRLSFFRDQVLVTALADDKIVANREFPAEAKVFPETTMLAFCPAVIQKIVQAFEGETLVIAFDPHQTRAAMFKSGDRLVLAVPLPIIPVK